MEYLIKMADMYSHLIDQIQFFRLQLFKKGDLLNLIKKNVQFIKGSYFISTLMSIKGEVSRYFFILIKRSKIKCL